MKKRVVYTIKHGYTNVRGVPPLFVNKLYTPLGLSGCQPSVLLHPPNITQRPLETASKILENRPKSRLCLFSSYLSDLLDARWLMLPTASYQESVGCSYGSRHGVAPS
jgi:hypothetical protein